MRKKGDENKPATLSDLNQLGTHLRSEMHEMRIEIKKIISDAVREIVEYIGVVHDKLDNKIDGVDSKLSSRIDGLSQELYETKVELRNEIRGLRSDHDSRLTRLEAGKLIT